MKKIILSFLVTSILIVSCKKEDNGTAPTLPPSNSMELKMDNFTENKSDSPDTSNWGYSAINVGVWNLILTVNLAIPVASFKEAFNHKAKYISDSEEWLWEYTVNVGNANFKAKLYGKDNGSEVNWRMLLTKTGNYTDFVWYTGTSQKDGLSGQWLLSKNPNAAVDYISIDWEKGSSDISSIKFTNVENGTAGKGGYIKYGINNNAALNAFYTIYNAEKENFNNIEWSTTNKNGRVKNPIYFNDSNWNCWNSALQNTVCE